TLAVGGGNDELIYLYDRQLNPVRKLVTRHGGVGVAFNHAGDRLVSVNWGGKVQLWDVVTAQLLFTHPRGIGVVCLRFSRDDQWLAGAILQNQLRIWKVGAGRDYRTLVRDGLPKDVHYVSAAVSGKQPQLLAVGMNDGVGFWNLDTGAELHFLARPGFVNQVVFEPSGTLLTIEEDSGVYRWVVPADFARPDGVRLGPPEKLPFPRGAHALAQSCDGRVLAICVRNLFGLEESVGTWVLHAGQPDRLVRLDAEDAAHIAVSPDGRWVATAKHFTDTLKIREARSGRLVRE